VKITPEIKPIVEAARQDWNNQCKLFMHRIPFRDKTAKDCFNRHLREAGIDVKKLK
jgi:hypothetical protein